MDEIEFLRRGFSNEELGDNYLEKKKELRVIKKFTGN